MQNDLRTLPIKADTPDTALDTMERDLKTAIGRLNTAITNLDAKLRDLLLMRPHLSDSAYDKALTGDPLAALPLYVSADAEGRALAELISDLNRNRDILAAKQHSIEAERLRRRVAAEELARRIQQAQRKAAQAADERQAGYERWLEGVANPQDYPPTWEEQQQREQARKAAVRQAVLDKQAAQAAKRATDEQARARKVAAILDLDAGALPLDAPVTKATRRR